MLNNNLKKYSAMTLIDRQSLNQVLTEQGLSLNGNYSDKDQVSIGQLTNTQYILTGSIRKIQQDQYSVDLHITEVASGEIRASFMKNGTVAEVQGGALINEATAELLAQMGVRLTGAGKQGLASGRAAAVKAETGLAKGITAQVSGASVQALLNYAQSVTFDPSQIEALGRLTVLSTEISGGTISQQILTDIEARRSWLGAFKETAAFFNDHPPFEITFDPNLIQEGTIDYVHERANLAMRIALDASEAGFEALNALISGLEGTGKRKEWGFSGWPLLDINPKTPEAVVFGGKRTFRFKIEVALVNEKGKTIGQDSITFDSEDVSFSAGDTGIKAPTGASGIIHFPKINADDLTNTLTVVVTRVNQLTGAAISDTGYMRIVAGDLSKRVLGDGNAVVATPDGFVRIQGGTFVMGSPSSEVDRSSSEVQHQVTVSSFYMGKYEVTQKEYRAVMRTNPSEFKGNERPVEQVSWFDAVEYCNKRSIKEGLTPAYTISGSGNSRSVTWNRNTNGYRLPTEAEWEYACRAGTTTPFYTGNNITTDQANYNGKYPYNNNAKGKDRDKTWTVGSGTPNPWGLYDMSGNVWEWCWDWYDDYGSGAQTDPVGASSGTIRLLRGGSWYRNGQSLRSASRYGFTPSERVDIFGFRLARPSL
jgi:formylglycine-generating enzyme required for sulfatase activity